MLGFDPTKEFQFLLRDMSWWLVVSVLPVVTACFRSSVGLSSKYWTACPVPTWAVAMLFRGFILFGSNVDCDQKTSNKPPRFFRFAASCRKEVACNLVSHCGIVDHLT